MIITYDEVAKSTNISMTYEERYDKTTELLEGLGLNKFSFGFKYIRTCILLILDEPYKICAIKYIIYPKAASINNTTIKVLEEKMSETLNRAEPSRLRDILIGKERSVPTEAFIDYVASYLYRFK